MSTRALRRLRGGNNLPPRDSSSDDDFDPLNTNKSPSNCFQGLQISSHSESDHDVSDTNNENTDSDVKRGAIKKKIKSGGNTKLKHTSSHRKGSRPSVSEVEDIDKVVMEVNAIMGPPPSQDKDMFMNLPLDLVTLEVCSTDRKHLVAENELNRKFGPDNTKEKKRRVRSALIDRLIKRPLLVPVDDYMLSFRKVGLTMSVHRTDLGRTYFTINHDEEYQKHQVRIRSNTPERAVANITDAMSRHNLEGMLLTADLYFLVENYTSANKILEELISYLQFVSHPSFDITDWKCRLEYRFTENRIFHVALLKYLHLLSNRACHRTALEMAKLLFNLDPQNDPLAMVLIMDMLAIRAREYDWLLKVVECRFYLNHVKLMYNFQFSCSLAKFHIANNKKGSMSEADHDLKRAMMQYPLVVKYIYECSSTKPSTAVRESPLFQDPGFTQKFKGLLLLYVKFTLARWREPPVFEWFIRNAEELGESYTTDPSVKETTKSLIEISTNLFQGYPPQVLRHLCVIKPMSDLLVEGAVPDVPEMPSEDPIPPSDGVDRYHYIARTTRNNQSHTPANILTLISSLLPNFANH